jgi:predicted transposase/invertase (TIGR01784 family)
LWVKFFSAETEEDLKMVATQEPIFKTAVKRLREVSASEERRYLADMRHKDMLDRNTARFVSRREGRAEGLAEGRAEGRAEIARNMKAEGYGNEEIAKITKLTVTQIEQI